MENSNNLDMNAIQEMMKNVDMNQVMGLLKNSDLSSMMSNVGAGLSPNQGNGSGINMAEVLTSLGSNANGNMLNNIEQYRTLFVLGNQVMSVMNKNQNFKKYKGLIMIAALYLISNPAILNGQNINRKL